MAMQVFEIFKRRFRLMTVRGIPVWTDYRWLFVLLLMSAVTAGTIGTAANGPPAYFSGIFVTLAFFASVLVHELAHAVVARIEGVDVTEIVLHPFGGLARLRREPETPRAEFRIAAAGPAASFGLSVLFVGLMAAAHAADAPSLGTAFFLLANFNFLVAVFNLFPGYPLDGGRLLRAYLWRSGRGIDESTVLTGRCGQIIGGALVLFGLYIVVIREDVFTGSWMLLVGLFLYDAAAGIIREVRLQENVGVMDVMMLPPEVPPGTTLQHLVDHILPMRRQAVFPVSSEKQLYGLLLLEDMKSIERDAWRTTSVRDVMRPVREEYFTDIRASLAEAREMMRDNGTGALCVLDDDGRLVGFLGGGIIIKRASRKN